MSYSAYSVLQYMYSTCPIVHVHLVLVRPVTVTVPSYLDTSKKFFRSYCKSLFRCQRLGEASAIGKLTLIVYCISGSLDYPLAYLEKHESCVADVGH